MTYFNKSFALDRLIREGQEYLNRKNETDYKNEIRNWICTAEDELRACLPDESALVEEVKHQRTDDVHIDVNVIIAALERAREILRRKHSNEEKESLKEEIRLLLNEGYLKSKILWTQAALVAITFIFAIAGIIRVGQFEFNFAQEIDKHTSNVKSEASGALENIRTLVATNERELNTAISRAITVSSNLEKEADKISSKHSKLEQGIKDLETTLDQKLSEAEESVLTQARKDAAIKIEGSIAQIVESERLRIVNKVSNHIKSLKEEQAPDISKTLATTLVQVGQLNELTGKLKETIGTIENTVKPLAKKVEYLKEDLDKLDKAFNKLDVNEKVGLIDKLKPSVDRATSISHWLWGSYAISGLALIVFIIVLITNKKHNKSTHSNA